MANHLFKALSPVLILAGAAAAWTAPRKPFSHKYHLKQVISCENCHKETTASTKAEDNLLPDNMACVTCHDEVEIGEPNKSGVDKFNHAIHVEMGKYRCLDFRGGEGENLSGRRTSIRGVPGEDPGSVLGLPPRNSGKR